ncbi:MAG: glycosyl transferase [Planctomycetota bacterium]|nr:MAG: glycosyl transferase [Planctomycetota bacterium]
MPDFMQTGPITTLHELRRNNLDEMEDALRQATQTYPLGLVLPVTAADMRAEPFARIVQELTEADYIHSIVVVLGNAPDRDDYRETLDRVAPLGERAGVLWTDGPGVQQAYRELSEAGFSIGPPGKGRSVWTAFGYLLADPSLKAFVLHDCDIVDYDRLLLTRLCLPMAHPGLDFDFCKAYYARVTDRMHGRVVRLLVLPLLNALISVLGPDPFLNFLSWFRYPLSGEFAVSAMLARANRIPSDWGLEVGTLAEVFRNTSVKRVCQVDLCRFYEHKHQDLSLEDRSKGLMKMATDVTITILRTLASRGAVYSHEHLVTLRAAYLRSAQDAIRQYHADAVVNRLRFDRHAEEQAVEGFAEQIEAAGRMFLEAPSSVAEIPNWTRVLSAFPNFPARLRAIARDDLRST